MEGIEMTSFTENDYIRKIMGLLKQAEGASAAGNEAEATAFNQKAAELIAKYGIDQALLVAKGEAKEEIVTGHIPMGDVYSMDKRVLLNCIVKALGAQVIFIRTRRRGTVQSYSTVGHVFAYQSDMDRIELLFNSLSAQMLSGAAAAEISLWENKRSFRKSWMSGFAAAIGTRLRNAEKQAVVNADADLVVDEDVQRDANGKALISMALVVIDRKKAVEDEYKRAHPKVVFTPRNLNGSGRSQGYAAGQRASLADKALTSGRKALVG